MKYSGTLKGGDGSLIIVSLNVDVIDGGHVLAEAEFGLQEPDAEPENQIQLPLAKANEPGAGTAAPVEPVNSTAAPVENSILPHTT